jgi:hypothetical protein
MINLIAKISGNYILLWQLHVIPSGKWQEAIMNRWHTVATNILLRDRSIRFFGLGFLWIWSQHFEAKWFQFQFSYSQRYINFSMLLL